MKNPLILSIETSLDDTCAAVTSGRRVISNIISSQVAHHEEFGGTVPDIAKRLHQEWLTPVVNKAISTAKIKNPEKEIDAIAVTQGPGLAPSLEQGIVKAKELAINWKLPLISVNHLEGHLLSSFALNSKGNGPLSNHKLNFPALGFIISGGHTELVLIKNVNNYQLLGQTLDDAAGEAYDKVARMLKLGYPGGPILSELALHGSPIYDLPLPMTQRKDLNFSFSGLKTAARYYLERNNPKLTQKFISDFSASFQHSVIYHLSQRFERAILKYNPLSILLGGGVVSNISIRKSAHKIANNYGIPVYIPYSKKLFTDNAAMIGIVANYKYKRKEFVDDLNNLDRLPNLNFKK